MKVTVDGLFAPGSARDGDPPFSEANPVPEMAVFEFPAPVDRVDVESRVRLAASQRVVAVADDERRRALCRGRGGHRDHRRLHGRHLMPDARVNVAARRFRAASRSRCGSSSGIAMETGYRTDESGKSIPRNVIRTFVCRYKAASRCSPRA